MNLYSFPSSRLRRPGLERGLSPLGSYANTNTSKAMLLNEVIAAVFVVLSSFRTLLSFKGTLYSVYSSSAVEEILEDRMCSQV